ncbi:hypothetical protein EP10_000039 [Geobacillus icigianus]|uniref:Uncharacterized protein n=1 Tax=Geobacillus icigianus TaxID=1430331 RepID=A0ABU6BB90_9BACL|nr:hypothetical protein [Geobacillus icigianus]
MSARDFHKTIHGQCLALHPRMKIIVRQGVQARKFHGQRLHLGGRKRSLTDAYVHESCMGHNLPFPQGGKKQAPVRHVHGTDHDKKLLHGEPCRSFLSAVDEPLCFAQLIRAHFARQKAADFIFIVTDLQPLFVNDDRSAQNARIFLNELI